MDFNDQLSLVYFLPCFHVILVMGKVFIPSDFLSGLIMMKFQIKENVGGNYEINLKKNDINKSAERNHLRNSRASVRFRGHLFLAKMGP